VKVVEATRVEELRRNLTKLNPSRPTTPTNLKEIARQRWAASTGRHCARRCIALAESQARRAT
jgi:hypothetical protein